MRAAREASSATILMRSWKSLIVNAFTVLPSQSKYPLGVVAGPIARLKLSRR